MNEENGEGKEVQIELPGGFKGLFKGYHLGNVLQLIIAAILGVGAFMFFQFWTEAKTTWANMSNAAKAEHSALSVSIDRQAEAQIEMNYILTLSPQDRERLNLSMPRSLREKIIRGSNR